MKEAVRQVKEFHEKHGFTTDTLDLNMLPTLSTISNISVVLKTLAQSHLELALEDEAENRGLALYRVHLMLEELHEVCSAMVERNEVKLADALADLLYVVIGTAITYHIPIGPVFDEVHESNMTKKIRDIVRDPRMRDKGQNYRKPRIAEILKENEK